MPIIGKTRLDWEVENTLMERAGAPARRLRKFCASRAVIASLAALAACWVVGRMNP
jgi:hypothetical protein